ncbi:hypothetical protein L202_06852 [Cryptococcus amylolentus CBS 6039]|uniref:Glycoside hydrolase family 71 protein n=1 Tax=Cryptococcus amylolentus CBS 6039 TaxID=1295533 RepID=A0A1E3HFC6_9TREE|nr:hypothetical protein L202_06852 [Cryptococcus amylolentus CBS 6039]ODN74466.1 hypothetical protein L202_06852 [Cryptococcus amylolentus CBS 6039]
MRLSLSLGLLVAALTTVGGVSLEYLKTGLAIAGESIHSELSRRNDTSSSAEQYVFAHFMVGFVDAYTQEDWTRDIELAASKGIDGFALNWDGQDANAQQLALAFKAASALSTPFKLFISPDFVHYSTEDHEPVSDLLKSWITEDAYFRYNDKSFVSSFWGEGTDWEAVETDVGQDLYVVPYYYASQSAAGTKGVDGLFSWSAWPGEGTEDVVNQNMTTDKDKEYLDLLGPLDKTYMAPVPPWFYAHLPASTGYSKNYYLYSDTLWPTRWQQILSLTKNYPDQLKFVEIITWNDWTDVEQRFRPFCFHGHMMGPFITAFKAGSEDVSVTENRLVYWYRPSLKDAECDSTDSVGSKPSGAEMAADSIFVAVGAATITVTSGSSTSSQIVDKAGVHTLSFPMKAGAVSFEMKMDNDGRVSGNGAIEVTSGCYVSHRSLKVILLLPSMLFLKSLVLPRGLPARIVRIPFRPQPRAILPE